MGIEKKVVSSKMRQENVDFLNWLVESVAPYEVSTSSLMNLCVSIVRSLFMQGDIVLNPQALQVLLRIKSLPLEAVTGPGLSLLAHKQARFNF